MVTSNAKEAIETLVLGLDEPIATIQKAISGFESGQRLNIAIIALPYAGKSELVDEIVKIHSHEVTTVRFSSIISSKDEISLPENSTKIIIFDNCHYLYMRKVGGFDVIKEFLNMVLSSDERLCITTWNIHSWNYLEQVLDIGRYFPIQVKIPPLNTADMEKFVLSVYEENEIQFVDDSDKKNTKIFTSVKIPITEKITHRTINLYSFQINYTALRILLFHIKKDENAESVIFKELTKVSHGNPGVATEIWNKWLEYPLIKTSSINSDFGDIDLDDTGAFVLYIVLSMGHIRKEELEIIMNQSHNVDEIMINKIIFEMLNQDLIAKNDEYYSVKPEKLYVVIKYLENIRLV
ncbi:hypothetical protein [uncultured Methanomethylovorans sp.]|uniref:hypothetical protein n=1 Tax=uncultured Methanomethylovorans sp. TaxID=183759 RepID=UPI002AA835EE|nr:hypothetical protein [uncultured Methanomethylovorans sp.]